MTNTCTCEPEINSLCVYCQVKPTPHSNEKGMVGQAIWLRLQEVGFVGKKSFHYSLTLFEQDLKDWLIRGKPFKKYE